jgi:hypothetical protein
MRMVRFTTVAASLAMVFGLAAIVRAEPLDVKQVAGDAKWVAHVDLDALRAATVFQKARQKFMETHKEAEQHLDKIKDTLGLDVRKDLHGATFYGKEIGKHTGVAIVQAKVDQKLLLAKAEKAPDHKVVKYGSYDVHTWTHKGHGETRTVAGTFYKDDRLVFASSLEELKAAIDVLDGKASGTGPAAPLNDPVPAGATVVLRATGLAGANLPGKCPIAKQVETLAIVMGEHDGKSFFEAKGAMANTEVVGQVKAIVEGAKALAALHCQDDPQAKKLVEALEVKVEGKTISLGWTASANDVWEVMQKHGKLLGEKRGELRDRLKKRFEEARKSHEKPSN